MSGSHVVELVECANVNKEHCVHVAAFLLPEAFLESCHVSEGLLL